MTGSVWNEETCRELFSALGGKENIAGISSCATRLRIRLYDKSRADKNGLASLTGIKGLIEHTDELHLIIGWEAGAFFRICSKEWNKQ
jgi:glucose-like phosphotransferase system IIB component